MSGHYVHLIERRDAVLSTARISRAARARIMGATFFPEPATKPRVAVVKKPPKPEPIAVNIIEPPAPPPPRPCTARQILDAVAESYKITLGALVSSQRPQRVAFARFAAAKLMHEKMRMSYSQIARALGQRCHTTIMHSVRRAADLLENDPQWAATYRAAEHALGQS